MFWAEKVFEERVSSFLITSFSFPTVADSWVVSSFQKFMYVQTKRSDFLIQQQEDFENLKICISKIGKNTLPNLIDILFIFTKDY